MKIKTHPLLSFLKLFSAVIFLVVTSEVFEAYANQQNAPMILWLISGAITIALFIFLKPPRKGNNDGNTNTPGANLRKPALGFR